MNFGSLKPKNVLLLVACMALGQTQAFAENDLEGSYRGSVAGAKNVQADLVLHSLADENRRGSYLALLIKSHPTRINFYQVDPIGDHRFQVIPRHLSSDGRMMGVTNADPVFVLKETEEGLEWVSANAGNESEEVFSMRFQGKSSSDVSWDEFNPGVYHGKDGDIRVNALSEGAVNLALTAPLSGDYRITRALHGVYRVDGVASTAEGSLDLKFPTRLMLFIHQGSNESLFFINPGSARNVREFKK